MWDLNQYHYNHSLWTCLLDWFFKNKIIRQNEKLISIHPSNPLKYNVWKGKFPHYILLRFAETGRLLYWLDCSSKFTELLMCAMSWLLGCKQDHVHLIIPTSVLKHNGFDFGRSKLIKLVFFCKFYCIIKSCYDLMMILKYW